MPEVSARLLQLLVRSALLSRSADAEEEPVLRKPSLADLEGMLEGRLQIERDHEIEECAAPVGHIQDPPVPCAFPGRGGLQRAEPRLVLAQHLSERGCKPFNDQGVQDDLFRAVNHLLLAHAAEKILGSEQELELLRGGGNRADGGRDRAGVGVVPPDRRLHSPLLQCAPDVRGHDGSVRA